MVYSIVGKLAKKADNFAAVEVGGIGLKILTNRKTLEKLPPARSDVKFFSYLYLREDTIELYGFASPAELDFFELLNSVAGVGPKSALSILDIAGIKDLAAAIKEGRPDLLTRASGIGLKTAERIILELKNKVESKESAFVVGKMEKDADLLEALVGLGYRRDEAKAALSKVDEKITNLEERLKTALKNLTRS